MSTEFVINDQIVAPTVRLVDDDKMIGVIPLRDALAQARARGLDLVLMSRGDPPVCRMLDADRLRFTRAKADREAARRHRELAITTKEVQLRPVTNTYDLAIKARRADGFLAAGDKVRVVMRLKGREASHRVEARQTAQRFLAALTVPYKTERPLADAHNTIVTVLAATVAKAELRRHKLATQDQPSTSIATEVTRARQAA